MREWILSRRTFLAAAGMSATMLVSVCDLAAAPSTVITPSPTPHPSPFEPGPYQTNRLILGEDAGTHAMLQPFAASKAPNLPATVLGAVYYPHDQSISNPSGISTRGPFSVLIYAHAFRQDDPQNTMIPRASRDFSMVDGMLR